MNDNDNRGKLKENLEKPYYGYFLKAYKAKNMPKLLEKVQRMDIEDAKFVSFKEAGVNLGRLAHIWEMGYLSGRKV